MSDRLPPAVGITKDGQLVTIPSADAIRGLALKAVLVSRDSHMWGHMHEKVMQECFAMNPGQNGEIIYLEGEEEAQTENTRGNRGARWENRR